MMTWPVRAAPTQKGTIHPKRKCIASKTAGSFMDNRSGVGEDRTAMLATVTRAVPVRGPPLLHAGDLAFTVIVGGETVVIRDGATDDPDLELSGVVPAWVAWFYGGASARALVDAGRLNRHGSARALIDFARSFGIAP